MSRILKEVAEAWADMSPCIRVCRLENGRCVGCHRTVEEIKEHGQRVSGYDGGVAAVCKTVTSETE